MPYFDGDKNRGRSKSELPINQTNKSHHKNRTVSRPSYLHDINPYTRPGRSCHWNGRGSGNIHNIVLIRTKRSRWHIYIYTSINEASLDSDNGLSPEWLRAIIWFKWFVKKWSYRSKLKSNLNGNMAISLKENDDHKMAVILSWPQCVDTNEMLLECISSGGMSSHI